MENTTKIYIGADHAGFKLKEKVKTYLQKKGYHVIDLGNTSYQPNDDYPIYGWNVARAIAQAKNALGILICGSAEGICIVANKVRGIRATIAFDKKTAAIAREHNDSNILCLSGWKTSTWKAKRIINTFLTTPFSNEKRHLRRIEQINKLERQQ